MDEVKQVTLIRTTNKRAGDGISDPIRVIEQYWNLDGSLLFEYDPHTGQATYYPHGYYPQILSVRPAAGL